MEGLEPVDFDAIDWSEFDYPIHAFHLSYGAWTMQPVPGEPEPDAATRDQLLDYEQFDVAYFARVGENDGEHWTFLVRHTNGYYVYFDASCDYTGFDCQGGGSIVYSRDSQQMWALGLTQEMRLELLVGSESDD